MRSYEVRRHVAAPPAAVWAVLTDADRLVAAGTGIARIEGRIEEGGTFTLWSEAVPDGGTDFHMREEFTGLLLPLVWRSMPDLQPSFDAFADGLARSTEAAR